MTRLRDWWVRFWDWLTLDKEDRIPDPLRVLPGAVYFLPDPDDRLTDPLDIESLDTEWVEMGHVTDKDELDWTTANEVIRSVFEYLNACAASSSEVAKIWWETWESLDPGVWEAITAQIGDPYRWPEIDRGPE